jgi:hypothetical protein
MIITLQDLKDKGACSGQVALFEATFGKEVAITKALLMKWCHEFDLNWVANHYLTGKRRVAYDKVMAPAEEAYYKARATAREAYNKAMAPAREAYNKAMATAGEAYNKAVATAGEAYDKARATAWEAYDKAMAMALWDQIKRR